MNLSIELRILPSRLLKAHDDGSRHWRVLFRPASRCERNRKHLVVSAEFLFMDTPFVGVALKRANGAAIDSEVHPQIVHACLLRRRAPQQSDHQSARTAPRSRATHAQRRPAHGKNQRAARKRRAAHRRHLRLFLERKIEVPSPLRSGSQVSNTLARSHPKPNPCCLADRSLFRQTPPQKSADPSTDTLSIHVFRMMPPMSAILLPILGAGRFPRQPNEPHPPRLDLPPL